MCAISFFILIIFCFLTWYHNFLTTYILLLTLVSVKEISYFMLLYLSHIMSCILFLIMGLSCSLYTLPLKVILCRLSLYLLHFLYRGICEELWGNLLLSFLPTLSILMWLPLIIQYCSFLLFILNNNKVETFFYFIQDV